MTKRKRETAEQVTGTPNGKSRKQGVVLQKDSKLPNPPSLTIQVITGSYESVLHGFSATIPSLLLDSSFSLPTSAGTDAPEGLDEPADPHSKTAQDTDTPKIAFADTFLLKDHTSSIRCLALSPPANQKVYLATGSSDERIVIYNVSTVPPPRKNDKAFSLPSVAGRTVAQNSKNHEIGQLLQHSSTITALHFPNRTKLLSASDDNTIAITRLRDMTALSTLKAPIPKPLGRPSGDTAAPGEVPAGINDFALHPDMKAMISVSKGERCMRLWNLTTGKKGGVLNFERDVLQQVREGKWGGEGRKVVWDKEEEFVVGFERGAVVYGLDSKPNARILPTPLTKIHHMEYVPGVENNILAVSTEDGRILFYRTSPLVLEVPVTEKDESSKPSTIPLSPCIAQLGGKEANFTGRIKDFAILQPGSDAASNNSLVVITGSSDGAVRIWRLNASEMDTRSRKAGNNDSYISPRDLPERLAVKQVGQVIGTCETGNRITCLKAFVMTGTAEDEADEVEEEAGARLGAERNDSGSDDDDSE